MKKIIMMALVLSSFGISAFANIDKNINGKAVSSFSKSFKYAENVRWEVRDNLYKVSFKSAGKEMFAYYNADGDQVALTRHLRTDQLPLALSSELTSLFDSSWLTQLFEVSSNGETSYYATIESPTHVTILKADGTTGWSTFSKDRKIRE